MDAEIEAIWEKCAVYHNDEKVSYVNPRLLDKQHAWGNLDAIKKLHLDRHVLEIRMKNSNDDETILSCYDDIKTIELDLQDLWRFERNPNYFKFWQVAHCTCPVYDNNDNYPYGPYVYNLECRIHKSRR